MVLDDATASAFGTALSLPTTINLADFPSALFVLVFANSDNTPSFVVGEVTSLTAAVPEPCSLALLGSGLIGLAVRRQRRR